MVQVIWSSAAKRLLQRAHNYIAADNPEAARRVVAGIFEKAKLLGRFPELGQVYMLPQLPELRALTYGHYRILYRIATGPQRVEIVGVFHGRMDIPRHLRNL